MTDLRPSRFRINAPPLEELPWCAVCDKPVDECRRFDETTTDAMVWIVRCHGAEERVRLTMAELARLGSAPRPGVAFQSAPALPARPERP